MLNEVDFLVWYRGTKSKLSQNGILIFYDKMGFYLV